MKPIRPNTAFANATVMLCIPAVLTVSLALLWDKFLREGSPSHLRSFP